MCELEYSEKNTILGYSFLLINAILRRNWSRHTFKLCEDLWRQKDIPELEGLENLADAVAQVSAYDLFGSYDGNPEDGETWKDIVYDYRWLNELQTSDLGFPPQT